MDTVLVNLISIQDSIALIGGNAVKKCYTNFAYAQRNGSERVGKKQMGRKLHIYTVSLWGVLQTWNRKYKTSRYPFHLVLPLNERRKGHNLWRSRRDCWKRWCVRARQNAASATLNSKRTGRAFWDKDRNCQLKLRHLVKKQDESEIREGQPEELSLRKVGARFVIVRG